MIVVGCLPHKRNLISLDTLDCFSVSVDEYELFLVTKVNESSAEAVLIHIRDVQVTARAEITVIAIEDRVVFSLVNEHV